jgi:hypothetical protein
MWLQRRNKIILMAIKKELSKECVKCGLVFDKTLSNKQPKRALCKPCYTIESQRISREQRERRAIVGAALNRVEAYKDYKLENRKGFWASINKEIRTLTKREDIRTFISKQMDRILEDKRLMQYINYISIAEQRKNENNKTK